MAWPSLSYAFTSEVLTLNSILVTLFQNRDNRLERFYHPVHAFIINENLRGFQSAVAAYENLQEYAQEMREESTSLANARDYASPLFSRPKFF